MTEIWVLRELIFYSAVVFYLRELSDWTNASFVSAAVLLMTSVYEAGQSVKK